MFRSSQEDQNTKTKPELALSQTPYYFAVLKEKIWTHLDFLSTPQPGERKMLLYLTYVADGPQRARLLIPPIVQRCHPTACCEGSSYLSQVLFLYVFYRDASSALLQLVNKILNLTVLTHAFRYQNPEYKSRFHKNRTPNVIHFMILLVEVSRSPMAATSSST